MSVTQKLIDNVNEMKTTLNEISVYNLDVYTAIELYYKLAEKTNEVINELSRFEGLVADEVIEQNKKLTYLLGEGLKLQVGFKIDELISNGTIQDLINNKIFNDLNNKIDVFKQEINEQINTIKSKIEDIKYKKILFDSYIQAGVSISDTLTNILNQYKDEGLEIVFSSNEYIFDKDIVIDNNLADTNYAKYRKIKFSSNVRPTFLFTSNNSNYAITIGKESWQYEPISNYAQGYIEVELNNIIFKNGSQSTTKKCINGLNSRRVKIVDCEVTNFIVDIKLQGAWDTSEIIKTRFNSTDESIRGIGLLIVNGSNALKVNQCSFLNKNIGILVEGQTGLTGSIQSVWIENNNFESSNTAIKINPLTTNVGSITISKNHFEYNDLILDVKNSSTIWGINFEKCVSLGYGSIKIGENGLTYEIKYFNIDNCSFLTNKDDIIDLGSTIKSYISNFHVGKIATYGNYTINKPIAELRENNNYSIYETMPLYNGSNDTPQGRGQLTLGKTGEIRWDEVNLYIKRNNTWGVIPVQQRSTYERNKKYRLSGVVSVPQQLQIGAWVSVDIPLNVEGVTTESGYVVNINPSKYLEEGFQYSVWVSGVNTITLRITNVSSNTKTLTQQNWFYNIDIIDN